MTVVLGLDPGSNITGYGIIHYQDRSARFIDCGCLYLKGYRLSQRLKQLQQDLEQLVDMHQPTTVAIEQVFMNRFADAALKLGQARGAAIVTLTQRQLAINEYAPRQVKQAVASYGGANKQQIRYMIAQLLQLNAQPSNDAADALAIALCHAHMSASQLIKECLL